MTLTRPRGTIQRGTAQFATQSIDVYIQNQIEARCAVMDAVPCSGIYTAGCWDGASLYYTTCRRAIQSTTVQATLDATDSVAQTFIGPGNMYVARHELSTLKLAPSQPVPLLFRPPTPRPRHPPQPHTMAAAAPRWAPTALTTRWETTDLMWEPPRTLAQVTFDNDQRLWFERHRGRLEDASHREAMILTRSFLLRDGKPPTLNEAGMEEARARALKGRLVLVGAPKTEGMAAKQGSGEMLDQ